LSEPPKELGALLEHTIRSQGFPSCAYPSQHLNDDVTCYREAAKCRKMVLGNTEDYNEFWKEGCIPPEEEIDTKEGDAE
jgi:hypothetical protein